MPSPIPRQKMEAIKAKCLKSSCTSLGLRKETGRPRRHSKGSFTSVRPFHTRVLCVTSAASGRQGIFWEQIKFTLLPHSRLDVPGY
jgi:hypothetical protein